MVTVQMPLFEAREKILWYNMAPYFSFAPLFCLYLDDVDVNEKRSEGSKMLTHIGDSVFDSILLQKMIKMKEDYVKSAL